MKSEVRVFDVVVVIILMEHTLMSCLFGFSEVPSVIFDTEFDYANARDLVLSALELDPSQLKNNHRRDVRRASRTPSPVRRLEEDSHNLFFGSGSQVNNASFSISGT